VFNALKAQKTKCQNRRQFCGRKKKLTPEKEALILRSILELRDEEGSFSSRRLMERTGIRRVTDRTVKRLLNRNGYFFLQARKKGLMSQTDKDQPEKCKQNTPRVFVQTLSLSIWMVSHLCTRLIRWTKLAPPKEEYGGKDLKA